MESGFAFGDLISGNSGTPNKILKAANRPPFRSSVDKITLAVPYNRLRKGKPLLPAEAVFVF